MAKNITVDNFEKEVLQAAGPVLVDFWATWCGPCRMQGPAVEKLAEEGYNVGKINVDDEGELAERYHVMNIPTLIIFKNGEEKERMVGVQSKDLLKHAGRHDRQGKKQQRFQDRAMKQIDLRTPPGLCL